MVTNNDIDDACTFLRLWYMEGKIIPGYREGYGRYFIAQLAGLQLPKDISQRQFRDLYNRSGSELIQMINGPHGWTLLQAAIAKYVHGDS